MAAAPVLPIGRLSDGFGLGLGATLGVDVTLHPHASFVGRAGYVHHLPSGANDATLGALPAWGGARYRFVEGDRTPYLEGLVGPTLLFVSVGWLLFFYTPGVAWGMFTLLFTPK